MNKRILTLDEVSSYTGMSKSYLYKLTATQKIPHYKPIGKLIYFEKDELDAWLLQNRVSTSNELESKAQAYCMSNKKGGKR